MKVLNPLISVVIPSRATNLVLLKNIFSCLEKQTFTEFEVIVVCDRYFNESERKKFLGEFDQFKLDVNFFSHVNGDFLPHSV
jgi:hypothetical protein